MDNPIKTRWAAGKPIINGWLSIASSFSAEIMAAQGFDTVTVDLQHGMVDTQSMVGMFQAMRASKVGILTRVPWLEPGAIMRALDAGAHGVICPMINNAQEAAEFVSYCRYPPHGTRSFGPTRAVFSLGADYYKHANDSIVCLAMIETADGVKNLEEIVATPGIDGVYIGPSDLTIGYTNGRLPAGFDREEDEMIEVIKRIKKAAHRAGIKAALHTGSADYAAKAIGWGFDMVTVRNDVGFLAAGAKAAVSRIHDLLGKATKETGPDANQAY